MTNSGSSGSTEGLKVAEMITSGKEQSEAIERAPGVYENRGIGNSYLLTTGEESVLVNAGTLGDARRGRALFDSVSKKPIRYIVLTQSHANQFGGLEVYKTPDNEVIAHRLYPEDRQYGRALQEHYQRGSRRIFGQMTGSVENILPLHEVSPDILIDEHHDFELGGRRFEIISTPGGETRSAVIVWLPAEEIAIVGNLFGPLFGNQPNLNTLRGDKPRSALQFIDSVRKLRSLAPRHILTGHEDIRGAEHIEAELTRIIDSVQWIHDKTLEGMNAGKDLRTLMGEIKPPDGLALTEEYGKVSWNVRAIWHEYTGWFDPSRGTTELYNVPFANVAPAIVELVGGTQNLVTKAGEFLDEGKPLEALHLLDIVFASDPDSCDGGPARLRALELLQQQVGDKNLWERRWIAAEKRDIEDQGC